MNERALPLSWRVTTLGEIAAPIPNAIVDGPFGSNLKRSDYVEKGVPVLQGKNITNDTFQWFDVRFISERKANELKRSSVRVGDILLVKIGSIGYSAVIRDLQGFDFAIIPANLVKITPNPAAIDTGYLHKWLTSLGAKRYLENAASKTAQPALSLGKIKSLPIPLPPLKEQKRIADILAKAEMLRAKRRAALTQLDTLTQAIFLDLFGYTKQFETLSLGDVAALKRGPFGGALKKEIFVPQGYMVYEQRNAIQNDFSIGRYFINERKYREMEGFAVMPDDLIVSCSGTLGRVAIVPEAVQPGVINQALLRIRVKRNKVMPLYLKYVLESIETQTKMTGISHGTGLQNFPPMSEIRSLRVAVPPLPLQHEFARRVDAVEKLKEAHRASLAEVDALFASLQHRAFRGEL